jgi:hypothetical protein
MFGELGLPMWVVTAALIGAPIVVAILGLSRSRRSN